jgi:hypothetical protein
MPIALQPDGSRHANDTSPDDRDCFGHKDVADGVRNVQCNKAMVPLEFPSSDAIPLNTSTNY